MSINRKIYAKTMSKAIVETLNKDDDAAKTIELLLASNLVNHDETIINIDSEELTTIEYAATCGRVHVIQMLMARENPGNISKAVKKAAQYHKYDCIDFITQQASPPQIEREAHLYAIKQALSNKTFETVKNLIRTQRVDGYDGILFSAIEYGDTALVKDLLIKGANAAEIRGKLKPIHFAIKKFGEGKSLNDMAMLCVFAEALEEKNDQYAFGDAVLYAAQKNYTSTLEHFIKKGANASKTGQIFVEGELKSCTDPTKPTNALEWAVYYSNQKMVEVLLSTEIKPEIVEGAHRKALEKNAWYIIQIFIKHQVKQVNGAKPQDSYFNASENKSVQPGQLSTLLPPAYTPASPQKIIQPPLAEPPPPAYTPPSPKSISTSSHSIFPTLAPVSSVSREVVSGARPSSTLPSNAVGLH